MNKLLLSPLISIALACAATQAHAQALVCNADRPVARVGESVELRVFGSDKAPAWEVSAGRLEGSGPRAQWHLPESTGKLSASVTAPGQATCALSVFVLGSERTPSPAPAPPPTTARETGTLWLVRGQQEPAGYGLYSYFLLGSAPDGKSRERVLAAIEAFLALSPSLASLDELLERGQLNANHMPVDAPPPSARPSAQWVLEHYDHARARSILARIDASLRQGPYLVSMGAPAGSRAPLAGPMLRQDLSAVPPHLVGDWYRLFLNQAAQERHWDKGQTLQEVGVRMRTVIGVLALGLPDVQAGVTRWVQWGK